jgi:hypothetical protein
VSGRNLDINLRGFGANGGKKIWPILAATSRGSSLIAFSPVTGLDGEIVSLEVRIDEGRNSHIDSAAECIYGTSAIFDGWYLTHPLRLIDDGGLAAIDEHFQNGGSRCGITGFLCEKIRATLGLNRNSRRWGLPPTL